MHPRHRLAISFLALLLVAVPSMSLAASPPGVNLMWSNCWGEGIGAQNRNFACASNSGNNLMVGSFQLSSDMIGVVGTEIIMQLASASAPLPPWWQFKNAGTCRSTSLSSTFVANVNDVVCVDWTQGQSAGGIGAYCTSTQQCIGNPSATNVAVVKLIHAVPSQAATDLIGGVEYYDFTLVVNNQKTVGTGACAGCATPVCIVLNSINVVAPNEQRFLGGPAHPGSNYITWQGGGVPVTPQGTGCPAATPTRQSTWGSVKSLYR